MNYHFGRLLTLVTTLTAVPAVVWADVAPELPPPLETNLPMPRHIVIAGLAFSVVLVLIGVRLVRHGKFNRMALNVLLFLVGAATASLAFYANKIRADYGAEVEKAREAQRNYRSGGPPRPEPAPLEPSEFDKDGDPPPDIDVPEVDLPDID